MRARSLCLSGSQAAEADSTDLRATISAMPPAGGGATCATIAAPQNGNVTMPVEFISGTVAVFACNPTYQLAGAGTVTCLLNGQPSGTTPSCTLIPILGLQSYPGSSCKAVYADYARHNLLSSLESGSQWLRLGRTTMQVYCDMDTTVRGGVGGWTLCGKLNRNGPGDRLLANGFGRSFTSGDDMATLGTFRCIGFGLISDLHSGKPPRGRCDVLREQTRPMMFAVLRGMAARALT